MKTILLNIILFIQCLLASEPDVKGGFDIVNRENVITESIDNICGNILSSDIISPKITDIVLKLETPCSVDKFDIRELENVVTSKNFDLNKKLVVYISGFLIGLPGTGVEVVRKAYHCRNDTNFVFADSTNFLNTILRWSVFNTQEIGEIIGQGLVKLVQEKMYPLENIHIIGHSLGVHIAGNAGRYFKAVTGKSIPRITGLDPANGCFNAGGNTGLQLDNAEFIDVIHTNPGVFGTTNHLGHVDFYVGGLNPIQNGCIIFGCSHIRACEYYAETVYPGNEQNFLARLCPSEKNINAFFCRGKPILAMGYNVLLKAQGIYYLKVNSKSPYGQNSKNNDFATSKCNLCKK